MAPDEPAYWCYSHQRIEPLHWLPHPDHLRIGPMRAAEARRWRDEVVTPWAREVLPLEE